MSHHASTWAWDQDVRNPRHKLLLVKLADSANDDGVCWPSLRTLAKHTGISKSALSRAARALEAAGLLRIQETTKSNGLKGGNVYHLALPGVQAATEPRVPLRRDTENRALSELPGVPPGRDRTVSRTLGPPEPSKPSAAAPQSPEHLGERRWSVVSSRSSKGPFTVDLEASTCTCENRHTTPCRHIKAAEKAEERVEKARQRVLREAVWDGLVEAFGQPTEKQKAGYGGLVSEVREQLLMEGIEETPERWKREVERRVAALTREWGVSRVTLRAFVQNWPLAGKVAGVLRTNGIVQDVGDGSGEVEAGGYTEYALRQAEKTRLEAGLDGDAG